MSTCTISIVTPSYNQADFLAAALESVFGQGYPSLEYLVLDGGSQDRRAAIIAGIERDRAASSGIAESGKRTCPR